jgi:hypothetical protein
MGGNDGRGLIMVYWSDSSGRLELQLSGDQTARGYHSGPCDLDIAALLQDPEISRQLSVFDPAQVAATLKEYGAWNSQDLANHADNLARLLWIACGDLVDQQFQGE